MNHSTLAPEALTMAPALSVRVSVLVSKKDAANKGEDANNAEERIQVIRKLD